MDDARTREWTAGVIERQRGAIEPWLAARVIALDPASYGSRPAAEVEGWVAAGVHALLAALGEGGAAAARDHARRISRERRALGFPIGDVVSASLLLVEAVAPHLEAAPAAPDVDRAAALALVVSRLRAFVATFTRSYAAAMRSSVEAERARSVALLQAVRDAGASLALDEVLERVADGIARALEARWCGLFFPGDDDRLFEPRGMAGQLGHDHLARLVGRVFERRADDVIGAPLLRRGPVVFRSGDDRCLLCGEACGTGGVGAAIGIPIRRGDRELAVALATAPDRAHEFGDEPLQLAWGLANIVAPAVDNARLHAETEHQLAESRALQRVMRSVVDERDLAKVLEVVCEEARDQTRSDGSAIYLFDHAGSEREPTLVTCRGPHCDHRASLTTLAARLARELSDGDDLLRRDDLDLPSDSGRTAPIGGVLAAPLRDEGAEVGLLLLLDPPRTIGPSGHRVLRLLADHATVAVRDERLRRQRERIAILEERERLAHELHDSVSQSLYGVTMYAEAAVRLVRGGDLARVENYLAELRGTALDALRQMRLVIFELRPPDLRERGLVAALGARLMAVEARSGVTADLAADLPERLPHRVEDALFGIAQEALNNALRHGRPRTIRVALRRAGRPGEGDAVALEVADDGAGFDPDAAETRGGLGLPGMEARARKVGGRVTVTGVPGEGVVVRATVPVPSTDRAAAGPPRPAPHTDDEEEAVP